MILCRRWCLLLTLWVLGLSLGSAAAAESPAAPSAQPASANAYPQGTHQLLVPAGEPYGRIRPLLSKLRAGEVGRSVAFSPDGRWLATGTQEGQIRLWDVASGRERARLQGHESSVTSVAFSPDGRSLASGSEDNTVRLWDVASGRERARLQGHDRSVTSVAFSPDGRSLASASDDVTVRLWDVASGRERARLQGHYSRVNSVTFSPDGRSLASASDDVTVRLWDVASGRERARLQGHYSRVNSVTFSPDGRSLASASWDKTVRLWDVASGRERARLKGDEFSVNSVAFSPDGRSLASASWDKTVRLWDVASGRERARLQGHEFSVNSVAFSPDGRSLASASDDVTVRLWDVASGRERARLQGHYSRVNSVTFSPDGRSLASGSVNGTVRLWDVASGRERARLQGHQARVTSLAFSPDGRSLASASWDTTLRLWDLTSGRERARLPGPATATSVAFSPDGRSLVTGSSGNTVRLWDVASGRERARLQGHESVVSSVAFSPDGRILASASWDKTVRLWDVASGRERARLQGHEDRVNSVAFSPDGRSLASASDDNTVRLWDVASGRERARLQGHYSRVNSVTFSPDGRSLASGSVNGTVRLWDVASGREQARLQGHESVVSSVAFSPDGRSLASGSWDNTVRLWDVASGADLATFVGGIGGQWAGCVRNLALCYRADIDLLANSSADGHELVFFKPEGATQPLQASLTQATGPAATPLAMDTAQPVELQYTVRNMGSAAAFWLELEADQELPHLLFASESARWMRLDAGQATTLALRVHLHPIRLNPGPADITIQPVLRQAYGAPIRLPPVLLRMLPPNLAITAAALQSQGEQRSLAVTLKNLGSAATGLVFNAKLGAAALPTEVTLKDLPAGGERTLSFGLDPAFKLPQGDLKASLLGQTQPGWPIHDWRFDDVPVRVPGLPLAMWAGAAMLALLLLAWIYFQRVYRHPLVLGLSRQPEDLLQLDPGQLETTRRLLQRAGRLDTVLGTTKVDAQWLSQAAAFDAAGDGLPALNALAHRLAADLTSVAGGAVLQLGERFPLNLARLRVHCARADDVPRDLFNRMANVPEVTLLLGRTQAQRQALSALAREQPGLLVAPDGAELTSMLLAQDPQDALARVVARYVPVTQISPYQTGAGVQRASMFFGRADLIAQVMGREPANYLVVGGRQVGKSSLLKEMARRFADDPSVDVHYTVLSDADLVGPLANALGLTTADAHTNASGIESIAQAVTQRPGRRIVFVIDEVDSFVEQERHNGYQVLQRLRSLSEQGRAQFIMAGFWSLYRHATLDYQSPLKNFGTVLTVGALEREACAALATLPMERVGIQWDNPVLVDRLVERTGQRANLVSIACDELINVIGTRARRIGPQQLEQVLDGNRLRGALEGWGDLGASARESQLDRIVAYATVERDTFTLAELMVWLEQAGMVVEPEEVKQSVMRLELAFVFARTGSHYRYQVPLQRELIQALDAQASLRRELRGFNANYGAAT